MRITMIGSGNVATVLSRRMHGAAHIIEQVYSRDPEHAAKLAIEVDADALASIDALSSSSDIYIISVADKAIPALAAQLRLAGKLVVHTAGSVPMNALEPISADYGVLYPLQTIRKELSVSPYLPVLVDGSSPWSRTRIFSFAQSFADRVEYANDEDRSKLHLAAVVSNNFSNYLFTLAEAYCRKEGVKFELIIPLLEETVKRLYDASPADVQTGPAIRGDVATMSKHLEMLKEHPDLKEAYEWFSRRIKPS